MKQLRYEDFEEEHDQDAGDWHVLKERPSMKYEQWKYPTVSGRSPPKQRDVGNVQVRSHGDDEIINSLFNCRYCSTRMMVESCRRVVV